MPSSSTGCPGRGFLLDKDQPGHAAAVEDLQPVIHNAEPLPLPQGRYVCVGLVHDALRFGTKLFRKEVVRSREPTVGIGD